MDNRNPFPVLICSICGKRVNVETCKTDEAGQAVHEECYVEKVQRERGAFKKPPVRVYPSR